MTVRELVEKLKQFDEDTEVWVLGDEEDNQVTDVKYGSVGGRVVNLILGE